MFVYNSLNALVWRNFESIFSIQEKQQTPWQHAIKRWSAQQSPATFRAKVWQFPIKSLKVKFWSGYMSKISLVTIKT